MERVEIAKLKSEAAKLKAERSKLEAEASFFVERTKTESSRLFIYGISTMTGLFLALIGLLKIMGGHYQ
jgi:hypothetical protein